MECARASELMSAVALAIVEDAERVEFHRHVAECPTCGAEFGRARGILAGLGAGAHAAFPGDLAARIAAAGRAELAAEHLVPGRRGLRTGRVPGSVRLLLGLLAPTAAAAVVALSLRLWNPRAGGEDACEHWCFVDKDAGNSRAVRAGRDCVPRHVLWETRLERTAGAYRPLVWKGSVIVGTGVTFGRRGGGLLALDARSGAMLWRRDYPSGDFHKAKGFPDRCIQGGRLHVTDGEQCIVLDATTGVETARFVPPDGANGWGYLAAKGRRLYGVARDGRATFCIDASSGRVVWMRHMGMPVFVPALSGGRLYVHTLDGDVAALDAASGVPAWQREQATAGGKAWVYAHGERVVALAQNGQVTLLDARTGDVRWSRRIRGAFTSGCAMGDHVVYALSGSLALDADDGHSLWHKSGMTSGICAPPTLADGLVLSVAGKVSGTLSVYSASGESLATLDDVAAEACDGVVVAGGKAYMVGGTRVLALGCAPRG